MLIQPIRSALILGLSFTSFSGATEEKWRPLLDEKLTHWEVWFGYPHPSVQGLPAEATAPDANGKKKPLGLNNDPKVAMMARAKTEVSAKRTQRLARVEKAASNMLASGRVRQSRKMDWGRGLAD